jgi:nitric oxide reductase activation protein
LGAALRYATRRWRTRREPERLILLLSDGRPHDVDVHDPHYLVADAQRAVDEARQAGVTVCALGLTPESAPALRLMLGPGAWELLAAAVAPSVALPAALGRILARA